ncbi:SDR family oxidoreductase [Pseudonocardia sp. N23]|uniref:SDR family oxidoreductase n=1 Tax=Pseudonocardia sp. N23 TaxID=1987376 RepID=UPI00209BF263|nr:SDR family oxidoreductase [Pseudonocardia sp. N23]
MGNVMRVVVVGGSGRIGSALVEHLRAAGHEAVPASPSTGVDTLTGAGVTEAVAGAQVVVDVSNSPSFADDDVLAFFTTSTRTLLDAARAAGVAHYVALSIVGTDTLPGSGYLRAKTAQEELITASGLPFTIVRATQFFEFIEPIADGSTVDGVVTLPAAQFQPVAAADVSALLAEVVVGEPAGTFDIAGPDRRPFEEFVRETLAARGDTRTVSSAPDAEYFGTRLEPGSLVPAGEARLLPTRFEDWLKG